MDQIAKAEHHGDETHKKGLLVKMVSKHLWKLVHSEKPDAYQAQAHHGID